MNHDIPAEDVEMMRKAVFGERPSIYAEFIEKESLDVQASRDAGRRIMTTRIYLHAGCKKESAEIMRPMQEFDKQRYAEAWAEFTKRKEDGRLRQVSDAPSIGEAYAKAQSA